MIILSGLLSYVGSSVRPTQNRIAFAIAVKHDVPACIDKFNQFTPGQSSSPLSE